jgi:hypothetical protein
MSLAIRAMPARHNPAMANKNSVIQTLTIEPRSSSFPTSNAPWKPTEAY